MIQILLATYNSSQFLREQLDSLFEQTCQTFEILIHDGGSKDNTLQIIADYQKRFPEKIRLLGSEPASACENFAKLLAAADGELLMFCDHDDVWKKDKIALSLAAYEKMEKQYGADFPILIFTDSIITDVDLVTRFPSMMRSQCLNRHRFTPGRTIIQNYASGNTMLFNRALQKWALPVSPEATMHDHWVALAAAFFGKVCYIDIPLILYRQHKNNVIGGFRYNLQSCLKKFLTESGLFRRKIHQDMKQAREMLAFHREKLSQEQQQLLNALENFEAMTKIQKWCFLLKNDMLKKGLLRNLAVFFVV